MARSAQSAPATDPASSCWPTEAQTRLLRAIFSAGPAHTQALEAWRTVVDLDRLDRPSLRLLPLLDERHRLGSSDPLQERARALAIDTATRNDGLVAAIAETTEVLRTAGIRSLLLKGTAMLARGFTTTSGRRMADADLLVPTDDALAARDALLAAGWHIHGRLDRSLLSVRHAVSFHTPGGASIDLHWHVLPECCGTDADASFWQNALPARLGEHDTATLCPTDMLLHTCVHGMQWSLTSPIRWISDALLILEHASIDWQRLAGEAESRVLVLPLRDTLAFLATTFDTPIPSWLTQRLQQATLPAWAEAEYRVKLAQRSPRRQLLFHWLLHRRFRATGTFIGDLITAPGYVYRRWPIASLLTAGRNAR